VGLGAGLVFVRMNSLSLLTDTVNYSTANLEHLETHDWLKNPGNRVVVKFPVVLC
jgi:hypothetical protein